MLSAIEAGDLSIKGRERSEMQTHSLFIQYVSLYEDAIKDAASKGLTIVTVRISDNEHLDQLLREELNRANYSVHYFPSDCVRTISWGK